MSEEKNLDPEEVKAFVGKLNEWAKTLSVKESVMLRALIDGDSDVSGYSQMGGMQVLESRVMSGFQTLQPNLNLNLNMIDTGTMQPPVNKSWEDCPYQ